MLQRNLPEEVKARKKSEYKEWKKKVRELIKESVWIGRGGDIQV